MNITKIWFDKEYIYGLGEDGNAYRQSLLWYPKLASATDKQKNSYTIGLEGFHWRELDEDISFESFFYSDAIPSPLQRFFLEHREINVAEFAKKVGINATLLRNYINGFKVPSKEREMFILQEIAKLGKEYIAASEI